MKKSFVIFLILITVLACKKLKFAPEGPTDVRVKNVSTLQFNELTVNTSGGVHNMGTIIPGDTSEYFRFEIAYSKAEISAMINGIFYTTGSVNVTYMNYIGQMKITYLVDVSGNMLEIKDLIPEEPLVLK